MTSDIASPNIIDTEIVKTLDEDNRLTRDYVDRVLVAVEDGNLNEVRRLVEPLHEADIAIRKARRTSHKPWRLDERRSAGRGQ
jgi:magnesium transporter